MRLLAALTVAAVAASLAIPAALAQDNVITRRKAVMKRLGEQSEIGAAILKGQAPYDPAKAATMFQVFKDGMPGFGALFPKGSGTGDTKAAAAIWDNPQGFEAAIASFEKAVADNAAAAATADGFKAAFTAVGTECRACHRAFVNR